MDQVVARAGDRLPLAERGMADLIDDEATGADVDEAAIWKDRRQANRLAVGVAMHIDVGVAAKLDRRDDDLPEVKGGLEVVWIT